MLREVVTPTRTHSNADITKEIGRNEITIVMSNTEHPAVRQTERKTREIKPYLAGYIIHNTVSKYISLRKKALSTISRNIIKWSTGIKALLVLRKANIKKIWNRLIANYQKKHKPPEYSRSAILIQSLYRKCLVHRITWKHHAIKAYCKPLVQQHKAKARFNMWKKTVQHDQIYIMSIVQLSFRIQNMQDYLTHNFQLFKRKLKEHLDQFKDHFRKTFDYSNWEGVVDKENRLCWTNQKEGITLYEMPYMECYRRNLRMIRKFAIALIKAFASIIHPIIYMFKLKIVEAQDSHHRDVRALRLLYIEQHI